MERLHVTDREEWRRWLERNHKSAHVIWLVYPRKQSGLPRIPYNDAVEEALCFGWIDSITKGVDEDNYSQRFTPRRPGSKYSQTNQERLRRLIQEGRVIPALLDAIGDMLDQPFLYPTDIVDLLRANAKAWQNFQLYSEPYRRIRIAYVDAARKRPEEFQKRLRNLIEKTEQDKQFGFGIESYY